MSLKIEKARLERDAKFIIDAQIQMALETENYVLKEENITRGVHAVFSDANKGQYWVAVMDGKPVGSLLQTFEWSDWRARTVWWIQSVYILKEFRGQGIYPKMYETLKSIVENDDSLAGIRLYVDKSNEKAHALYNKLGMNSSHYHLCEWMKF